MANFVCNIAKGRVTELYNRITANDPVNSAFLLIAVETSGLETDNVLKDKSTVADFFSGTTNEQIAIGRVTLTNVELSAFPSADNTNDRYSLTLPNFGYVSATGNAISKMLVAYDPNTASSSDSTRIPCVVFDFVLTPDGNSVSVTGGEFYRATD